MIRADGFLSGVVVRFVGSFRACVEFTWLVL